LFAKIQSLRSHGITRQKDRLQNESHGGWYYEQHSLGYNYRMTDVQAALGSSQLSKLDDFIGKRHEIAVRYDKSLSDLPIRIQRRPVESFSSLHLYIIQLLDGAPMSRRQLYDHLIGKSIGVNVHYIPVHLQPFYLNMGFARGDFVSAEKYYDCSLSLPLHPKLTVEEQEYITGTLRDALE
jgi:dTDP-4-amino-4,6-dideoxygalactose transaminase